VEGQGRKGDIYGSSTDHKSVEAVKREMNVNPNQSRVSLKCMLLSCIHDAILLCTQHISKHDEQNIFNLELALFCLKCNS
jgi:hypothetical protein